ncbi:hypothetical protein SRIMM317S_05419 [Streptomyces rimosus subsp. rimosus]
MSAIIHIQNMAPAPPRVMAVATPAMLPVPTRAAAEMVKAPKDETGLEPSARGCDLSLSTRSISGKSRSCTALERTVK